MARSLLALGSERPAELGTSSDDMASIGDSAHSTTKNLNFDIAARTLLPQLQQLQAKLEAGDRSSVKESLALLPKFLRQLRPATADGFKDTLQKTIQDWLDSPAPANQADEEPCGLKALSGELSSATLALPPVLRAWY